MWEASHHQERNSITMKVFHVFVKPLMTPSSSLYLLALPFSWVVSASVLELTDWLSEFLLLSPSFLSLFNRLSVSLSPYLLLITGVGAGNPTLDLKAPVPRLQIKRGHKVLINLNVNLQLCFISSSLDPRCIWINDTNSHRTR